MKFSVSGIDKIKVILNPFFLNKTIPRDIRPDNALTIHHFGIYTYLEIHAEYFIPNLDYKLQISKAIYELIMKKVILFPMNNPVLTMWFVINNLNCFILGVSQVEIYFDFPLGKVIVSQDVIDNNVIKQYKTKDGTPTETYYSSDNSHDRNIFCIYNKQEKLIHDNRTKYKDIEDSKIGYRIEARLSRENCFFMDLDNLRGTYDEIFKRFLPLLSILYFRYLYGNITVIGKSNTYFNRLLWNSKKGKVQYNNRGRLVKAKPIKEQMPENGTGRKQMEKVLLEKYHMEVENAQNPIEMIKDVDSLTDLALS